MTAWTSLTSAHGKAYLQTSARLNHFLHCEAVIALPGGVGTLSEMALVWAASQTERRSMPLVLLGDCWLPVIKSIREYLVVGDVDLNLLRFAATPEEALQEMHMGLQDKKRTGPGPYG